jgi:hypothetical protein
MNVRFWQIALKKFSWLATDRDSLMRRSQPEDRAMMGERLVMQESLFYAFRLEDHVPCDHLLRRIDRFVDCSALRQHLACFYSSTGRPSIDPELMINAICQYRTSRPSRGPWLRSRLRDRKNAHPPLENVSQSLMWRQHLVLEPAS